MEVGVGSVFTWGRNGKVVCTGIHKYEGEHIVNMDSKAYYAAHIGSAATISKRDTDTFESGTVVKEVQHYLELVSLERGGWPMKWYLEWSIKKLRGKNESPEQTAVAALEGAEPGSDS